MLAFVSPLLIDFGQDHGAAYNDGRALVADSGGKDRIESQVTTTGKALGKQYPNNSMTFLVKAGNERGVLRYSVAHVNQKHWRQGLNGLT